MESPWPSQQADGSEWGPEAGDLVAIVTAADMAVYVRNAGTFATAVVTGGDVYRRGAVARLTHQTARQPDFVFTDRTGNLRRSMRVLGSRNEVWFGVRMGGVNAPYGGYLEALRPVLDISSRIAMSQLEG